MKNHNQPQTNKWNHKIFELFSTLSNTGESTAGNQLLYAFRQWSQVNDIIISLSDKHCCYYDIARRTLLFQSPEAAASIGLPDYLANVPQAMLELGVIHKNSTDSYRKFYESMCVGIPEGSTDFLYCHPQTGQEIWYHACYRLIYQDSEPICSIILYEDITKKRNLELAYQSLKSRSEIESTDSIGYYEYNLTDDIFEQVTGVMSSRIPLSWRQSFTSISRYCADYCVHPEDREIYLEAFDRDNLLLQYYNGETNIQVEHRRFRNDGQIFWALGEIRLVFDPYSQKIKAFVLIHDIDYKKQEVLHLIKLSQTDYLTGIYNRRAFISHVSEKLQAEKESCCYSLLLIDLDHFKNLNDTLGHQYGDKILAQIGAKLELLLTPHGFCGRIGGDEFAAFVECSAGTAQVKALASAICRNLYIVLEQDIRLSASIGIAFCPQNGRDFKSLYACADAALYCVKDGARNGYLCYSEDILPRDSSWKIVP